MCTCTASSTPVPYTTQDLIQRIQTMGVTPKRDNESWSSYLQRVEETYTYLKTGRVQNV